MNNIILCYLQVAVCLWLLNLGFLVINLPRLGLLRLWVQGGLFVLIPIAAVIIYRRYLHYKETHLLELPADINYPYKIKIPFHCTVLLGENEILYSSKDTFFKKKAHFKYSQIENACEHRQGNVGLGGAVMEACSIHVKYKKSNSDIHESPNSKNQDIYILVSWMKNYDYTVLIKTLKEKCPPNTFDMNLLNDFEDTT